MLMKSNLNDVLTAIDLSKVVMRRIRINFVWAFAYNLSMVPFAAGVLYPFLLIQLPPMFAGAAMALSSVSVVCSSLMLHLYKPPHCDYGEADSYDEGSSPGFAGMRGAPGGRLGVGGGSRALAHRRLLETGREMHSVSRLSPALSPSRAARGHCEELA